MIVITHYCYMCETELYCVQRKGEKPTGIHNTEEQAMKTKQDLIEKAKKEWGETWDEGMIEYNAEYNEYIVWVGKPDIYKAFFDADTLSCTGTKC